MLAAWNDGAVAFDRHPAATQAEGRQRLFDRRLTVKVLSLSVDQDLGHGCALCSNAARLAVQALVYLRRQSTATTTSTTGFC